MSALRELERPGQLPVERPQAAAPVDYELSGELVLPVGLGKFSRSAEMDDHRPVVAIPSFGQGSFELRHERSLLVERKGADRDTWPKRT